MTDINKPALCPCTLIICFAFRTQSQPCCTKVHYLCSTVTVFCVFLQNKMHVDHEDAQQKEQADLPNQTGEEGASPGSESKVSSSGVAAGQLCTFTIAAS